MRGIRTFNGKKYILQLKTKSKKRVEEEKRKWKNLIKERTSPNFRLSFRTIKTKKNGKTLYELYRISYYKK